jgi:hypothetical protein
MSISDSTPSPARLFSFTRCENDETCRYKRYLSREWGGTGLVPIQDGWDLYFGGCLHRQLDVLAKTGTVDPLVVRQEVYDEALKYFDAIHAQDWAMLAEGLIRGFVKAIWPVWMREYEVFDSERWISYEAAPGFIFRARQDLLLKSRRDGHLRYIEYKTTGSDKPEWIASWAKSVQIHSSMYVLKAAQGLEVADCVVQGLYKGYKDKKKLMQRSVFSYGNVNRQYSMTPEYSYEYQRSKGWESFSTWNEFKDLTEWVEGMPHEILMNQFPQTGPIPPREDIAETWFRQQLIREAEVSHAMEMLAKADTVESIQRILDTYFRQNFSHCEPAYGFKCEFRHLCWQPWVAADPLESKLYKRYDAEAVE